MALISSFTGAGNANGELFTEGGTVDDSAARSAPAALSAPAA